MCPFSYLLKIYYIKNFDIKAFFSIFSLCLPHCNVNIAMHMFDFTRAGQARGKVVLPITASDRSVFSAAPFGDRLTALAHGVGKIARRKKQSRTQYVLGLSALLMGTFFFTGANAVLTTLIVLEAKSLNFSSTFIGLLTSFYFAGFIAACVYGGNVVARVGHVRAFAGFAGLATIVALIHPILPFAAVWMGLRVMSGFAHAMLQMIVESWLNSASSSETRSSLISVYRIIDLSSVTLAQFTLVFRDSGENLLFSLIAISICCSLAPIVFSKTAGPAPIAQTRPNLKKLYASSPMAAAGAFGVGLLSAGLWGLSPVFLTSLDYQTEAVALFISTVIVGGALLQWPVGKISDLIDRRLVIMAAAGIGALAALVLAIAPVSLPVILGAGFVFGGAVLPIYALSVSHANDWASQDDFVMLAGALLLSFGFGAVIGPTVFSAVMQIFGSAALFYAMAMAQILLIAFGYWRIRTRAAVASADKGNFVSVTRSTPEVFELDPRSADTPASSEKNDSASLPPQFKPQEL